jgi:hypothetical protein
VTKGASPRRRTVRWGDRAGAAVSRLTVPRWITPELKGIGPNMRPPPLCVEPDVAGQGVRVHRVGVPLSPSGGKGAGRDGVQQWVDVMATSCVEERQPLSELRVAVLCLTAQ